MADSRIDSDDIMVPHVRNRDTGYANCEVCGSEVGQFGYGEETGHALTECLQVIVKLIREKSNGN